MVQQQKHFETENKAYLAVKIEEAKQAYIGEMQQVKAENLGHLEDITRLNDEVKSLKEQIED